MYHRLRPRARVDRSRDRGLYDAAITHFDRWRAALVASGINLANVSRRRPRHVDREMMILWLQHRHAASQTLVYTEVSLENRDHALAIRRTFGSWQKALNAAGNDADN